MDQPNTNFQRSIIPAPDPSRDNNYSRAAALRGLVVYERNEMVMRTPDLSREARLEKELEKQRIREEVILDMMRRREIEAKFRQELAMEGLALWGESFKARAAPRLMMLDMPIRVGHNIPDALPEPISVGLDRRSGVSFTGQMSEPRLVSQETPVGISHNIPNALPEPRSVGLDRQTGVSLTGQMLEPRLASREKPVGISLGDMVTSPVEAEAEPLPFRRNPEGVKLLELNKAKLKDMVKPCSTSVGMKRKFEPKVWTCSLCNITSLYKRNHEVHLQGRRHQFKAQMAESTKMVGGSSLANSTEEKVPEMDAGTKGRFENLMKRFAFCCFVCNIGCDTEEVLRKHCSGSKHAKRLAALKSGETTGSSTLDHCAGEVGAVEGTGEVSMVEGTGEDSEGEGE